MSRTYDPQSVIELPRLDADSAVSLGTSLLTLASEEKHLPAHVHTAVVRLGVAVTGLQATRLVEQPPESKLLLAMRLESAGWVGLEQYLKALAAVPGAKAVAAQALLDAVFPDGVRFLRGVVLKRWPATEARIQHLGKDAAIAAVGVVGAADLVAHLVKSHLATGEAAGITAPKAAIESPHVKDHLDAVKAGLRALVLQWVASAALDDSGTAQALADKMLKPLADYKPQSTGKVAAQAAGVASVGAVALAKPESVG
jgi:hypothetical protein